MKRYRYASITGLLFLLTLPWTHTVFGQAGGKFDIVLLILTAAAFLFSFSAGKIRRRKGDGRLLRLLITASAYLIFQVFTTTDDIGRALTGRSLSYFLCNFILLYIVVQIVYALTFRLTLTADIVTIASFLIGGIDYYVVQFRGQPIMPWDLMALKTAESVADQYAIAPVKAVVYAYLLMMVTHQLVALFEAQPDQRTLRGTLVALSVAAIAACAYGGVFQKYVRDTFWDLAYGYEKYGVLPGFLHYMPYMKYEAPKGYTAEKARRILDETPTVSARQGETQAANVIVIMNESLADLRIYGNEDLQWNVTPYMDSLKEDTVRGNLYVPVFGGNTCNTEFEFLTGASLKYVKGVPYLTFFQEDRPVGSLTDLFVKKDFRTAAFHPYFITNWHRNIAYADMGIRDMYDMEVLDMEDEQTYIRSMVRDTADYDFVIADYERHKDRNYFMFNVTLQNHGGYKKRYDNFTTQEDLSYCGDFPQAEEYLGLVSESDAAFEKLVDHFKQVKEPTLICMFGDHQPALEDEFFDYLYGKPSEELTPEEQQKKYITPFLLWANYDIPEETIERMSANYLGMYVAKTANMELPPYESFLYQLYREYPVISEYGCYDRKGNYYGPDSGLDETERFKEYQYVQYYRLNDEKNDE